MTVTSLLEWKMVNIQELGIYPTFVTLGDEGELYVTGKKVS